MAIWFTGFFQFSYDKIKNNKERVVIMKKKFSGILSSLLAATLLFTGCNIGGPTNESASNTSGNAKGASNTAGTNEAMGRYVQKEIALEGAENAAIKQFNQKSDGTLLLSFYDNEGRQPHALYYQNESWVEQDNKVVLDFIKEQSPEEQTTFYDYAGNWWVYLTKADASGENSIPHIYKLNKEGVSTEITVPYIEKAIAAKEQLSVSDFQPTEYGKVCFTLLNHKVEACYIIIDSETNKAVQEIIPAVPEYNPFLKEDKLYAFDMNAKTVNSYDISTGKRADSFSVAVEYPSTYAIDDQGQLVYLDMGGIHKFAPNGSVVQTVVEGNGFAFSTPNSQKLKLLPTKEGSYLLACEETGISIYSYVMDMTIPTAYPEKLCVWAMEDSFTVRGAASAFAAEYPDCEVILEFGKSKDAAAMTDEDVIKSLNTRLLAGEAPDVLILDGLPINGLIDQGLLSPLEGIVEESEYYQNILNCYQKDGKAYAYPTTFSIPAIASSKNAHNIGEIDNLTKLAELYKDKNAVENIAYRDVFETVYSAYSGRIFPAGERLEEKELREFLTHTKAMVEGQGITKEDVEYSMSAGNSKGTIDLRPSPSLSAFMQGQRPVGTGIFESSTRVMQMFMLSEDIRICPIPGNGFMPLFISSIPTDALNKDKAKSFIKILLSDITTQVTSFDAGFSVHKESEKKCFEMLMEQVKGAGIELKSNPQTFDWGSLIGQLNEPSNLEAFLQTTLYEQATQLYTNAIDVDTAVMRTVDKTKLYFAEKQ